jgi:transcription elongation factor SPT6
MDILEEINIKTVNSIGIDINLLSDHEHWYNQLQFLSGLGPRKAQKFLQKLKSLGQPLQTRNDIHNQKILKKNCFVSALAFLKIRVKNSDGDQKQNILDQTRIHIKFYDKVYKIVTDFLFEN